MGIPMFRMTIIALIFLVAAGVTALRATTTVLQNLASVCIVITDSGGPPEFLTVDWYTQTEITALQYEHRHETLGHDHWAEEDSSPGCTGSRVLHRYFPRRDRGTSSNPLYVGFVASINTPKPSEICYDSDYRAASWSEIEDVDDHVESEQAQSCLGVECPY